MAELASNPDIEYITLDRPVRRAMKAATIATATTDMERLPPPGNDPFVITVGAMKTLGTPSLSDDEVASYSSKGPSLIDHVVKPDIVAPGNRVVSLLSGPDAHLAVNYPATQVPVSFYQSGGAAIPSTSYFQLSGTSMAAPVVSGAVALLA